MSSPAAHTDSHAAAEHHENKFHLFVQVAMILAVITGVEIVAIKLPFPAWLVITALVVLSVVKFMMVIFIFMHLKWDKVFCTILFFIGLILGGGTLLALLALFRMDASIPLTFVP
jgi:cytochrome c oxidase subunit 4